MNKYLLFAGEEYYPRGGFEDFICEEDSIQELHLIAEKPQAIDGYRLSERVFDWYHIVDKNTNEIVFNNSDYLIIDTEAVSEIADVEKDVQQACTQCNLEIVHSFKSEKRVFFKFTNGSTDVWSVVSKMKKRYKQI